CLLPFLTPPLTVGLAASFAYGIALSGLSLPNRIMSNSLSYGLNPRLRKNVLTPANQRFLIEDRDPLSLIHAYVLADFVGGDDPVDVPPRGPHHAGYVALREPNGDLGAAIGSEPADSLRESDKLPGHSALDLKRREPLNLFVSET